MVALFLLFLGEVQSSPCKGAFQPSGYEALLNEGGTAGGAATSRDICEDGTGVGLLQLKQAGSPAPLSRGRGAGGPDAMVMHR